MPTLDGWLHAREKSQETECGIIRLSLRTIIGNGLSSGKHWEILKPSSSLWLQCELHVSPLFVWYSADHSLYSGNTMPSTFASQVSVKIQIAIFVKLTICLVFKPNCKRLWFFSLADDGYFCVSSSGHPACNFSHFLLHCLSSQQHPASFIRSSIYTALNRCIFASRTPRKQPSRPPRRLLSHIHVSTAA